MGPMLVRNYQLKPVAVEYYREEYLSREMTTITDFLAEQTIVSSAPLLNTY